MLASVSTKLLTPKIARCSLARCSKPIVRRLVYENGDDTYCSYACFTEALRKGKIMTIQPDEPIVKKKKKKKRPVEAPENKGPVSTKNKGGDAEPKKKKKKKPPSATLFREGSMVGQLYERLKEGTAMSMERLFKGIESGDASRLLTDLRNKGKSSGEFVIERDKETGKLKLVTGKAAKATAE